MTVGELWPHLRPLCRALALLGWVASAVGMAAGLSFAISGGTSLYPTLQALELI
jgi:dienelactone hydrolase